MQSRPFLTHRPRLRTALSSLALAALCCLPQAGAQSAAATGGSTAAPYRLRIVGGLAGINQYTRQEEPFWSKELSRLSGGRFEAEIVPFDRAGVPGAEMLRLLQLGVVPFGTTLMSSFTAQYPEYTAPDLAGLNPDIATLKSTLTAFRPYLEKALRDQHGVEALAVYVYPAQVVFCKKPLRTLSDLAGRRTRVSSSTRPILSVPWAGCRCSPALRRSCPASPPATPSARSPAPCPATRWACPRSRRTCMPCP